MGDSYNNNQTGGSDFQNQRQPVRNNFRGGRGPSNKEGGFRIRLSDNEMRAARSLQEAFNLRSTVAVLGFAVRTLAQMLEAGSLDDLVNQYRSQASNNDQRRGRGERGNFDNVNSNAINTKPNPFERPEKPVKEQEQEVSTTDESNNIVQDNEDGKSNDQVPANTPKENDATNTSEKG
tara:strand:+ start:3137 stop:3670 length:534 start_codon:yes stop_codon:yes gene_type:complete